MSLPRLFLACGIFVAAAALPLFAADPTPKDTKPAEESAKDSKQSPVVAEEPKLSVTQHTVTINGKTISYKATVGYLVLKQEVAPDGHPQKDDSDKKPGGDESKDDLKPWAKIFFIAYTRDGMDPATRPVTFAFNGGPGAASVWLHLGALGPRRVKLGEIGDGPTAPPYALVDNESSWLDDTDLVFIDPVSTGYSRPATGESAQTFHGYEPDIKSVAEFVRLYITRNKQWLAPKFIIGESYGGARAAGLSAYLQDMENIYVNGVIIVSGLLNAQTIDSNPGNNDLPYSLFLPGYAATAWYHKKLPPDMQAKTAEEVRKEAEEFAAKEYPLALMQGTALPEADQKQIAQKISSFTGLPVDLILRYHLRISAGLFRQELMKGDNRLIGRFDSRVSGIGYDPDGDDFDPSFEAIKGAYTATINDYLRNELKFETDIPYETLAEISWKGPESHYLEVERSLSNAMSQNASMKVWVVAGYYDLAIAYSATQYAVRQMLIDPALRPNLSLTTYEGGHMIYNNEPSRKKFKADFETFLNGALHTK